MLRRAAQAAAAPTTAKTAACQTPPAFQALENLTSQRTKRSQPARNGTSHQALTASAASAAVAAQRAARPKEAPLVANSTAHTTATPGTTVTLNSIAAPATTPHVTGRWQQAAQAATCRPMTAASMAGHEPKNVLCWWKPERTQCI